MANLDTLLADALKEQQILEEKNSIIDANIAKTKADFAAYNGLALTHPTLSLTTLQIDTGSYNGTTNNEITIAIDGGGTWTTVKAIVRLPAGQKMATLRPNGAVAYEAIYKEFNGDDSLPGTVTGATAYEVLRKLRIHTILDV